LVKDTTERMDNYDTVRAGRPIREFIDDLSTWYLRRSRDRFKGIDEADRQAALATLKEVLMTLSKVMAPFMPFLSDKIYLTLGGEGESVHLSDWPEVNKAWLDDKILEQMASAKKIVELGLALRAEKGLKVRQPLSKLVVVGCDFSEEMKKIMAEELNVKKVIVEEKKIPSGLAVKEEGEIKLGLDVEITEELKKEGLLRELVRTINQKRKEKGLTPADTVTVFWASEHPAMAAVFKDYAGALKMAVKAKDLIWEEKENMEETEVEGGKLKLLLV